MGENFATALPGADKSPDSGMDALVFLQPFMGEGFGAAFEGTDNRLVPAMATLVFLQGGELGEGLATAFPEAGKRPFSGMDTCVYLQGTRVRESVATAVMGADKGTLSGMNTQVPFHAPAVARLHPAVREGTGKERPALETLTDCRCRYQCCGERCREPFWLWRQALGDKVVHGAFLASDETLFDSAVAMVTGGRSQGCQSF